VPLYAGFAVLTLLILYTPEIIQFVLPVTSPCILPRDPITVFFDRIGLNEGEDEFCAYTSMGATFKTTIIYSPAIAAMTFYFYS
jgi:hypothetical protein